MGSAEETNKHITKVYGSEMDPEVVKGMFKVADTDGDGEVSLDEFKVIMRAGPDTKPKKGDATAAAADAPKPFYKKCLPEAADAPTLRRLQTIPIHDNVVPRFC